MKQWSFVNVMRKMGMCIKRGANLSVSHKWHTFNFGLAGGAIKIINVGSSPKSNRHILGENKGFYFVVSSGYTYENIAEFL